VTVKRLHHNAYVSRDQEATRAFYEDVIGLRLVATWAEVEEGTNKEFVHTFFGLDDGSALAFFQFADPADQDAFTPAQGLNPYVHVAMKVDADGQKGIGDRLAASGQDPLVINHGYCRSLYCTDPNGLLLEFTVDHPDVATIDTIRRANAHEDLKRWLAGDHTSNNDWRADT
jgi:catechol 2,3-dioxygenase-like lactoylglutathione lyase family enzyme